MGVSRSGEVIASSDHTAEGREPRRGSLGHGLDNGPAAAGSRKRTSRPPSNGYLIENVPRSAGILKAMPAVENSHLVAPQLPGLGLELNEEAVRRFTYTA